MRAAKTNQPDGHALTRRQLISAMAIACLGGAGFVLGGCTASPTSDVGIASGQTAPSSTATSVGKPSGTTVGRPPAAAQQFKEISTTLFAFDTVVTLRASCAQETLDALADRCQYFESIFSRTIETSDIGRVNAAGGKPVEVAPETADIVQKALVYCDESGGLFDITIGAVSSLWDFKEGVVPDKAAVAEAIKHVNYKNVQVDGTTITLLDAQAKLDLGGIAKGYIADDLCKQLIEAGCDSGFVNLGGNVKTVGVKPDGSEWHVGIQDPNDVEGAVVAAVYSQDESAVTSGLYERQFVKGGKKYWHILDPKTGYPVETDLVSATIISDASIDGDGFTKPLFMMGHDAALEWINAKDGIEGLVVDMNGTITQSEGCDAELV